MNEDLLRTIRKFYTRAINRGERKRICTSECIPWYFLSPAFSTPDGIGVAVLHLVEAGWGVDWSLGGVPPDSWNKTWRGPLWTKGLHYDDGGILKPEKGLGILHLDGPKLQEVYAQFGYPNTISPYLLDEMTVAEVLDSHYCLYWSSWANTLVHRPEFKEWSNLYWLEHWWRPRFAGGARADQIIPTLDANLAKVPKPLYASLKRRMVSLLRQFAPAL